MASAGASAEAPALVLISRVLEQLLCDERDALSAADEVVAYYTRLSHEQLAVLAATWA